MVISATVTPITPVRRFLSVTRKQFLAGPLIRIATSGFWASIGFARAIRKTNAIAERIMSFMVCVYWGCVWGWAVLPGPLSAATGVICLVRRRQDQSGKSLHQLGVPLIGQHRLEARFDRTFRQLHPRAAT